MRLARLALVLALDVVAVRAGATGQADAAFGSPAAALGSTVVIIALDGDQRPLPGVAFLARCPEGGAWRATTDGKGFGVIADVPPCLLSVAAVPERPGAVFRVERPEARVAATFGERLVRDMPTSGNAWSMLETVEPAAILDRIDGAGLHPGEPGRFSMRGASWTQNAVLLDGVDLTDPLRGGTPLAPPEVLALDRIEAVSGLAPVEQGEPGVALSLVSRDPGRAWRGSVEAEAVPSGGSAPTGSGPPPGARFGSLARVAAFASGPVGERLRLSLAGGLDRARRYEGDDPAVLESRLVSGRGELAWRPGDRDDLRLLVSIQGAHRPFAGRALFLDEGPSEAADVLGAQGRWTRVLDVGTLSLAAGFWSGLFEPQTAGHAAGRPVERTVDGPVGELVFPSRSRRNVASGEAGFARRATRWLGLWHAPRAGASFRRASAEDQPGEETPIPETVGGLSARVWEYAWPGADSSREATSLAAWAADRIVLGDRLLVEAGLRLESSTGSAGEGVQGVSWTTLSPRASARLRLIERGRLSLFGGYAEYAHALRLEPLAFGDPNGPHALVYRWEDRNGDGRFDPAERGVLVARVGPGAGDGTLTAVDPALRPPRTRELVAGLEWSPGRGFRVSFTAFDRRERDLLETVDVGVPISGYTVRYLPDPSGDIQGPQDDQLLPVYDRKPETFGLDRYLLTNPAGHGSLHQSVELRVEKAVGERLVLLAGATAGRTETAGANRGFRVNENDQGVIGEIDDDPNADTHSYGRSFFDRAFTIKLAGAYRAPGDVRLGVVARYQDGQPFGRLVVVPDLAQGPEAIPATPRGQIARSWAVDAQGRYVVPSGHRFTYTLTVDARLEKGFRIGRSRLALFAQAFNLLGTRNEVEENPVWGPSFRTPTAVQPPRAVALGLRLDD
ncbi:MAG TPA: TonB-dependent receptor [Vicinamibacteria bacterium]|nr:TonB-dependent receptor [Vicinamibacteria bacterium]